MNRYFKILVVDDEPPFRQVMERILRKKGFDVDMASSGQEALEKIKHSRYDLVLTDLIMKGIDGIKLLEILKTEETDLEVIMVTGYGSVKNAVEAMRKGAFSYFIKSHNPDELLMEIEKVKKIIELKTENELLKDNQAQSPFIIESKSPKFRQVVDIAKKITKSNSNVLILGESGTGKEIIARYIHENSARSSRQFMPVNCHAFSGTLIESELYGYEKGSFTGAMKDRRGRIEASGGGTLFLDEIGDMQLDTQIKLLRTLETKKIERIGSNQSIFVDFRLISATNSDIKEKIANGSFREDFFYRISTIIIELPPLRERKEDLPALIDFFIKKFQVEQQKTILEVEQDVISYLMTYNYPGNVRELKNIIERLVVLSENGILRKEDLPSFNRNNYKEV